MYFSWRRFVRFIICASSVSFQHSNTVEWAMALSNVLELDLVKIYLAITPQILHFATVMRFKWWAWWNIWIYHKRQKEIQNIANAWIITHFASETSKNSEWKANYKALLALPALGYIFCENYPHNWISLAIRVELIWNRCNIILPWVGRSKRWKQNKVWNITLN